MRVRQVDWIEPIEAARRLASLPRLSLLDSAMAHPILGRWSVLAADPFGIFTAGDDGVRWNGASLEAPPIDALRACLARHALPRREPHRASPLPPFAGGAIGVFSYEFGWALEGRSPPHSRAAPDIDLAFYDLGVAFDHGEGRCLLISSGHPGTTAANRRARAFAVSF